jgi:hypothetical protein
MSGISGVSPKFVTGQSSTTVGGPDADYIKSLVDKSDKKALSASDAASLDAFIQANPNKVQSFNITPKLEMGVSDKAYIVKGELYEEVSPLTYPPQHNFFDCGAAPAALPR